jgi:flagellar protein FliO/FliZ
MDKTVEKEAVKSQKQNKKINLSHGYFEYFKIILVLVIMVGIIYFVSKFMKKKLKIKDDVGDKAVVISSQTLGPGKWIQTVFIGGKYLILGVTNDNVNLISEITDPKEIERLEISINTRKTDDGESFMDVLSGFFKNTLKTKPPKEKFDYETDSVDFLKKQKDRIDKLGE